MASLMNMVGFKLIVDHDLTIVKHHKKKRIRNKWIKQGYPRIIDRNFYKQGWNIICHPVQKVKLIKTLETQ